MTEERLVFGVIVDQLDELNTLLRTITAHGDVITVGCDEPLHPQTVSPLGEVVFNAALAVRRSSIGSKRRNSPWKRVTLALSVDSGRPREWICGG